MHSGAMIFLSYFYISSSVKTAEQRQSFLGGRFRRKEDKLIIPVKNLMFTSSLCIHVLTYLWFCFYVFLCQFCFSTFYRETIGSS